MPRPAPRSPRAPRPRRVLEILGILFLVAVGALLLAVHVPGPRRLVLAATLSGTGCRADVAEARLVPLGTTFGLQARGLEIGCAGGGLRVEIAHILVPLPDGLPILLRRELRVAFLEAEGVRVHALHQRRPVGTPAAGLLRRFSADEVAVTAGWYGADADPPLPAVEVEDIHCVLQGLSFDTATGLLDGRGAVRVARVTSGTLVVADLRADALTVSAGTVEIPPISFRHAGGTGTFQGRVTGFPQAPDLDVTVTLADGDLAPVVAVATGRSGPVRGRITGTFAWRSGASLPRGGGWLDGDVRLADATVDVGVPQVPEARRLLREAPWLEVTDSGWVDVGDLSGHLRVERDRVALERLEWRGPRRSLRLDARVEPAGSLALLEARQDRTPAPVTLAFVESGTHRSVLVTPPDEPLASGR